VDQHGQVIEVCLWQRRDVASARTFFTAALTVHGVATEVITDRAAALASVIEDLVPAALHYTDGCENNRVECDHGRGKARLRPMPWTEDRANGERGGPGHAFVQSLRRGHYELGVDVRGLQEPCAVGTPLAA